MKRDVFGYEQETAKEPNEEAVDSPEFLAYAKDIRRACALNETLIKSSPELSTHVDEVRGNARAALVGPMSNPQRIMRLPLAFAGDEENGSVLIHIYPYLTGRITHLVVTPETAETYALDALRIGFMTQVPMAAEAIPLTCFDVRYAASNQKLAELLRLDSDTFTPGMKITLMAHRDRPGQAPRFEGLLWCLCVVP